MQVANAAVALATLSDVKEEAVQKHRRQRLQALAEHQDFGGQGALAAVLGYKPEAGYIGQLIRGDRPITEKFVGKVDGVRGGKFKGWFDIQHSPAGLGPSAVAHDLSLPKHSDVLLEISWESLVGNVPDSLFILALRDDALAPDYPRGTAVVWSKTRAARPGRLVLVRDKYGRDHVRIYYDGRVPGQWTAAARNAAYASFDPVEDGLQILAVHRGVLDAGD